jgi:hypothetical protein
MSKKLLFSGMLIGLLALGMTVVSCGGPIDDDLVGEWINEGIGNSYEFVKDGTFKMNGTVGVKYKWSAADNLITMDTPATPYGTTLNTSHYVISGGTKLTITEAKDYSIVSNGVYNKK